MRLAEAELRAARAGNGAFDGLIAVSLRPRGPYSLRLSTRLASDATRVAANGTLRAAFQIDGRLEIADVRQGADGTLRLRAPSEEAVERLRFTLGLDRDHSPFLNRFSDDHLLGPSIRRLRGLRPLSCATVTHALLRALCGQLIAARRARAIERRIVRAAMPAAGGLHAAPTPETLARFSPAQLRALGLGGPRASALVRVCRSLELERLRDVSTEAAATRLARESRIGPWSVGVVCIEGLGRYDRGLIGDLGLVKLLSRIRRRPVEGWETAELLEPYGEWSGLASVYMLAGFQQGLIPVPQRLAA